MPLIDVFDNISGYRQDKIIVCLSAVALRNIIFSKCNRTSPKKASYRTVQYEYVLYRHTQRWKEYKNILLK